MRKVIFGGIAAIAIVAVVVVNVNLNLEKESNLSILALSNLEALANGEVFDPNKWTELKDETNSYANGVLYKQSVIIDCMQGGTKSSCSKSCKYRVVKDDQGNWTDWMPC